MSEKPHLTPQELSNKIEAQMAEAEILCLPVDENEMASNSAYRRALVRAREHEAQCTQEQPTDTNNNPS